MAYWKDNYLIPKEGPDNADEKTCEHFNIKMGTLRNYWKILKLSTELQELCFNPEFSSIIIGNIKRSGIFIRRTKGIV